MLRVCSWSVLESYICHCLYQFLCIVTRLIWKEKERPNNRVVQMDNLRGLLGIRRMDKVLNAWIRELCRMTKRVDKRINEDVLR